MFHTQFDEIFEKQVEVCRRMLTNKAREYADDSDRMHNFKLAAKLAQTTSAKALAGMMIKHTVSIYNMLEGERPVTDYTEEQWTEKITDHINYLILLKALITEEVHAETVGMEPLFVHNTTIPIAG